MNPSQKVRLAFIGCGRHSLGQLQPNARLVDEIELVAVCDLDEERARHAADKWGAKWYTDHKEMAEKEPLDAVVAVGPPPMQHAVAKEMLERGLHVFVEKPPGLSSDDAKELVDAAERSGVFGMVGTEWRHAPVFVMAKECMAKKEFGRPTHCESLFFAHDTERAMPEWGIDSAIWAWLMMAGTHQVDATRFLMGDIAAVHTFLDGTDEQFFSMGASLRFRNGATGTLSMTARSPHYTVAHRITSDSGGLVAIQDLRRITYAAPPHWTGDEWAGLWGHPAQTWTHGPTRESYRHPGLYEEFKHFAVSILAGKQPQPNLADGYEAMRVLEAIRESAASGRPIPVGPGDAES